jgi:hypothetical protein
MNVTMDMDTETSPSTIEQRDGVLSELPKDDFGTVRERRDFGPLEVSLLPILPSPFRDLSFSGLTGWRYHPTAYEEDRLQMGRLLEGRPSNRMVIPDSWNDRVIDHSAAVESTRRQFEKLNSLVENTKRRKVNDSESDSDLLEPMEETKPPELPPTQPVPVPVPITTTPFNNAAIEDHDMETTESSKPDSIPTEEATVVTASTASTITEGASTNSPNPAVDLAGSDVIPKQELYFLYGKKPRTVQIKASDYLTWDNGKPVQSVKFTSAFVCPITKEIFLAKSYGDPSSFEKEGGIYWYPKKNMAEYAAAARAFDCWNLREQRHDKKRLSLEAPYSVEDAPELPIHQFPPPIREKVLAIQEERAALPINTSMRSIQPPPVSSRPPVESSGHTTDGRGWYGSRSTTTNDHRRDRFENSRFPPLFLNNGEVPPRQIKQEPTTSHASYTTTGNSQSRRWQTGGGRISDEYRPDRSESGRFVDHYSTSGTEPHGRFRDYQGYRGGNHSYQNPHFAGRHSYHSHNNNESMPGRAYGRGQRDRYYYNSSTSQSGRWRQNTESVTTTRRLQDRYVGDPNQDPPTRNQSNHDDEW